MHEPYRNGGVLSTNDNNQNKTALSLWFSTERQIELIKTTFKSPSISRDLCAIRGKTAGAFASCATFQWTAAVQALSVLLLKAVIRDKSGCRSFEPLLEGGKGTIASSLDAALYKQNSWLELFGSTATGDLLSRRIITRTNPGRKRFGPVMISLNERILPAGAITVYLDNRPINDVPTLTRCVEAIEYAWQSEREPLFSGNPLSVINPLRL